MNIFDDDVSGCVDCLFFVAYGDVPDDRPELPNEITAQWPEPFRVVNNNPEGEDDGHFSWHPCRVCGSHLGGQRYQFAILEPKELTS